MPTLVVYALVGLMAQLVDGSLGMAFGVTATTGLLAIGTAPAVASASVHLAELGTTVASGLSHWRFGNVDWRVVGWLAMPGAIGGFAGATVLASLSTEAAEPWMAALLLALGAYVLLRFTLRPSRIRPMTPAGRRWLAPLGTVAGFVDATGGGGWGPIATPALLTSGRLDPRRTIGSVDTSEFLVALAASVGFLLALGSEVFAVPVVLGLLIGGVLAAPLAAWLVSRVSTRIIGAAAGGLIVVTNTDKILDTLTGPGLLRTASYVLVVAVWVLAVVWAIRAVQRDRRPVAVEPAPASDVDDPARL
ncbi:MAG: sulfite exporter TauE/SafE family protein [Pseudonocardiaceae bacterium]